MVTSVEGVCENVVRERGEGEHVGRRHCGKVEADSGALEVDGTL